MPSPRFVPPAVLLVLTLASTHAGAQGGMLDPTFGTGGVASLGIGRPLPVATESIALRADGGIVLGGAADDDFAATALRPDGSLDADWGDGGQVREVLAGPRRPLTLLSDGRVLLGGSVSLFPETGNGFGVVRLDVNGERDLSFGGDGLVTVDFGAGNEWVTHFAAMPDGRLVAAGVHNASGLRSLAIARLLANGEADLSFGDDGRVLIPIAASFPNDEADALLVDAQGRIVIARVAQSGGTGIEIFRLGTDGASDPSFGVAGVTIVTVPSGYIAARALGELSDGRLIIIGHEAVGDGYDAALARLTPDGLLDQTFGSGGLLNVDFGSRFDGVDAGALMTDGRMVLAGSRFGATSYDAVLARRQPDGSADLTFGIGGQVRLDFDGGADLATGVAVAPDGTVAMLGRAVIDGDENEVVGRLLASGGVDTGFGQDGFVERTFRRPDAIANAVVSAGDGALYVAGTASVATSTEDDFFVARLLADGRRDTSFGNDGVAIIDAGSRTDIGRTLALYPDGRLIVAGNGGSPVPRFTAVRLLPDGTPDPTFGTGGLVSLVVGPSNDPTGVNAVALQPDGRVVLVGSAAFPSSIGGWQVAVARLMPNGELDPSFGSGGIATAGAVTYVDRGRAVALQSDGGIVVAGQMTPAPSTIPRPAVIRFGPDGTLDSTFGQNGYAINWVQNGFYGAMAQMPDGRLVASGWAQRPVPYLRDVLVVRLLPDGTPDPTFSEDGVAVSDAVDDDEASSVAALPDGRVAAAGWTEDAASFDTDWVVHVYRADGAPDIDFAGDGRVELDFQGRDEAALGITAHAAEGIVVVGFGNRTVGNDAIAARYLTAPATGTDDWPTPSQPNLALHPNPASARAAVQFELDQPAHARICVYDILGREVAVLWGGIL